MPTITYIDENKLEVKLKYRKMNSKEFWKIQGLDQKDITSDDNYDLLANAIKTVIINPKDVNVETMPAEIFFEIFVEAAGGALAQSKKLAEM